MSDNRAGTALTNRPSTDLVIPIGTNVSSVDLGALPREQQTALLKDHMSGLLDIDRKARELSVDVSTLRETLNTLTKTTNEATSAGNAVTITHVEDNRDTGRRTEVIMGNTPTAQQGKLNSRQAGARDLTLYYVLAAIIAVVVIAVAFAK